ncbi:hypothetical protein [Candidatus Spongiihabitans sp.]|uniref:hypothetical protein n=1 Tax=Candidatus Spongiihabitans sp. TaxID=3101308 RepID=UPI003C7D38A6
MLLSVATPTVCRAQEDSAYDNATGLFIAPGYRAVIAHCTACHSAKLITQQGASYESWNETIIWMQEEQGLWHIDEVPLTEILLYLSTHYGEDRLHWRPPSDADNPDRSN